MLSKKLAYAELGPDYRRRADAARYERKLIEKVEGQCPGMGWKIGGCGIPVPGGPRS